MKRHKCHPPRAWGRRHDPDLPWTCDCGLSWYHVMVDVRWYGRFGIKQWRWRRYRAVR